MSVGGGEGGGCDLVMSVQCAFCHRIEAFLGPIFIPFQPVSYTYQRLWYVLWVSAYKRALTNGTIVALWWTIRLWCNGSLDRALMVDPLSYFLFQPLLHGWCKKRS